MSMVEVVTAVIAHRGRTLMVQRPHDKREFPMGWESPGGKLEKGETDEEYLVREIDEELGIVVMDVPDEPFWTGTLLKVAECGNIDFFTSRFYGITNFVGTPKLREKQAGFGWFLPDELDSLTLLPANRTALEDVKAFVRRT